MKAKRTRMFVVAVMLAGTLFVAAAGSAAAQCPNTVSGAIFTTDRNGTLVNGNVYGDCCNVFLNGGPPPHAPCDAGGLPEGDYVYMVTDPSGAVLLSTDQASHRIFHVTANPNVAPSHRGEGAMTSAMGPYARCKHEIGIGKCGAPYVSVQLMPFSKTPNPGGVYKVWATPLSCYLTVNGKIDGKPVSGAGISFGFQHSKSKTDNFKCTPGCGVECPIIDEKCNDPGHPYATIPVADLGYPTATGDGCTVVSATPITPPLNRYPLGMTTVVWTVILSDNSVMECNEYVTVLPCGGTGCQMRCPSVGPFCTDPGKTTYTLKAGDIQPPAVIPADDEVNCGEPTFVSISTDPAGANVVSNSLTATLSAGTYFANWTNVDPMGVVGEAHCIFVINQSPLVAVPDVTACLENLPATVAAEVTGGSGQYSYAWTGPDGTGPFPNAASIAVSVAGQYCVTVTDTGTNCTGQACGRLKVNPRPDCSITVDAGVTTLCAVAGMKSYEWSGAGSGTSQCIPVVGPGTYKVKITDDNGCTNTCSFCIQLGGGGGLTPGYWSNQNGECSLNNEGGGWTDNRAFLSGLNLLDGNSQPFDPANYTQFREWLLGGNAVNMCYMLSVQLAAMELNVHLNPVYNCAGALVGGVKGGMYIYAPGTASANAAGFATVNAVMAEANAFLGAHVGIIVGSESPDRALAAALKDALDAANNNRNFLVGGVPGPCP